MPLADPWDVHLEALTAGLSGLAEGARTGKYRLTTASSWFAEFRASGRSVHIGFQWNGPTPPVLSDYQLVVIYGLGFHAPGQPARPVAFAKTLTLHEGFHWDDQTLRELAESIDDVGRWWP